MSKKFLLYFKKINMEKTNLILLKNKFHVIELNNISSINNLNQKIREKITIIYCDPSYFYSKFYLEKFINLKILASSTTGKGFIDENFK